MGVNEPPFRGEVLCAPDSFKGTLTADEAAEVIGRGVRRIWPRAPLRLLPLADGGEGSITVLHRAVGGVFRRVTVEGPLGDPVDAAYLELDDGLAVVEMAQASGLLLVAPELRNAEKASTYGTGQLITAALHGGAKRIIVCLGGSATTDGGSGMAEALGFRLLDGNGQTVPRGGSALRDLQGIDDTDVDERLAQVEFVAATDVTNPLCGPQGAAAVFGPQKGAGPDAVRRLEQGLRRLAETLHRERGMDVLNLPGGGAAGGLGAGLAGFLNARIQSGAETLMDAARVDEAIRGASLCITGEGRIDAQSAGGKLLGRLALRCKKGRVALIALGGAVASDAALNEDGFGVILSSTTEPGDPPQSKDEAAERLEAAAARACQLIVLGAQLQQSG